MTRNNLGPLIFQFEYLNKKKMNSLGEFIIRFCSFIRELPAGYDYFVKTGNPNYLKTPYFDFLADKQVETFLYVNKHFEESAPRTITRIEKSTFSDLTDH